MTALAPEPPPTAGEPVDDTLTHAVCPCNDDLALCGANVAGQTWADESEDVDCVVCLDLVEQPCQRCGQ
ncbi:hypothetical protein ACIRJO_02740 [Streptomyces sp. NPDC102394]|uniref:hypothetical protein n=1 Tax=Streptomyces sp. NPDC102394 TaxID=3366167 RepID=UPI003821A22A